MKKIVSLLLIFCMLFALAACGSTAAEPSAPAETAAPEATAEPADETPVRIAVLAGPTGIGAVDLWAKADAGEAQGSYSFSLMGSNDEVVAAISNGDIDMAAIATNLASALYNKTEGQITVLAVNTLGVLSMLTNGEELASIADLQGRTIVAPGQGANPEYILRYVLTENGLDPDSDVNIQFVSEGSELLTVWANQPDAVIMAPQPVATALQMQNENAKTVFDMTEEWDKVSGGESRLMMGCLIVRNDFLNEHPEAVNRFLSEYEQSIDQAQSDPASTAANCEAYGIIAKAAIAQKAIPSCGLTYVTGAEMKNDLSGYLQVMFDANPKSVGGQLPGDSFYYGA